ncbi:MAG: peptide chain release factor 2 [Candidatus Paceibacterota bacterium]
MLWIVFDLEAKAKRIQELENLQASPDFWNDPQEAAKLQKELSDTKDELETIKDLQKESKEIGELFEMAQTDSSLQEELDKHISELKKKIEKQEMKVFLSGKYDKGDAILSINSGAGGNEAEDWASMLSRMYQRWADKKGFSISILDESRGEVSPETGKAGLKSISMEISGKYAYGYLHKESGVHRLVRISPFSAQSLRHTSFAGVEVMPLISDIDAKSFELNPAEIRMETSKSGGAGGQNVNKRETAVRIVHIPSNIAVTCSSERSQLLNREKAIKILKSKLFQLKEQERQEEISKMKGERRSVDFGSQIRSYVLHPYKLVKDLRTDYETSQAEGVLDGDLDGFIEAELKDTSI